MRELTKAEYDNHYQRYIPSLAWLLGLFEVEYVQAPPANDLWMHLRPMPKDAICEVAAYRRDDKQPGYDVGVVYYINKVNPLALLSNETPIKFIRDLEHGASCGCTGCYGRIQRQWQYFQNRKAAEKELEQAEKPSSEVK